MENPKPDLVLEKKQRKRYSREQIMAIFDHMSTVASVIVPLTIDPNHEFPGTVSSRTTRKKTGHSQSSDGDGHKTRGSSREDLSVQDVDTTTTSSGWHRVHRSALHGSQQAYGSHPGYAPYHQRQRHPSGPVGDVEGSLLNHSNGTLRPSNETKRGSHGDWSRGCVGWRQRSYSGSEQSDVFVHNHSGHRGRGRNHHIESDGPTQRVRGRGRGLGRQQTPHHDPTSQNFNASSRIRRPLSCLGDVSGALPSSDVTEEFWQDEDWENVELKQDKNDIHDQTVPITPTTSPVPVDLQIANLKIHSKPSMTDPPPGFDVASKEGFTNILESSNLISDANLIPVNSASAASVITTPSSHSWYYIDLFKKTQGPFSNQQMATWLAEGYLPLAVKIRRDCDECFLSLADHMNLAHRVPFWSGYNQPPINHSNVSSLILSSVWVTQPASSQLATQSNVRTESELSSIDVKMNENPSLSPTTISISNPSTCEPTVQLSVSGPSIEECRPVIIPEGSNVLSTPLLDLQSQTQSTSLQSKNVIDPIRSNQELIRLYNEAQVLAAHKTKVEAEHLALANKLAAINTAAAKILASQILISPVSQTNPVTFETPELVQPVQNQPLKENIKPVQLNPEENPETHSLDFKNHLANKQLDSKNNLQHIDLEEESNEKSKVLSVDYEVEKKVTTKNSKLSADEGSVQKKNKRKNKKSKKMIAEREKELAWEAEFNRRKAAALEQRLNEEARIKQIEEEEAAALVAEQALIAQENARVLADLRKRELARIKAESEISQFQLPQSAKWATGNAVPIEKSSESLRLIQASQAAEEAKTKQSETITNYQPPTSQHDSVSSKIPQQTWSAVARSDVRPKIPPQVMETVTNKPVITPERVKHVQIGVTVPIGHHTMTDQSHSSIAFHSKSNDTIHNPINPISTTNVTSNNTGKNKSIWDLLVSDGNTKIGGDNKKQNAKKKKKSRELASGVAREELAHWCESQLSSIPLSGVDLPTLVDLLCELQTTDEIIEFVESSLGKSKRISKFCQDLIKKRSNLFSNAL